MGIPAKRFTFLDEETNVAVADLYTENNDSILNSPINDYNPLDADMDEFLSNAVQSVKSKMPIDAIPSNMRQSLDGLGDLQDLENLNPKDLQAMVTSLMPGSSLGQSALSKLSNRCKQRAAGRRGSGRPYGQANNCGGNTRPVASGTGCSSQNFGSALHSASNGAFSFDFLDLDSMFGNLMGLSSLGYDMNMCNVFGTLSQGLPTNMLSRASGGLLGGLTASSNVMGMLDLASSSGALKTKLFNPSAITSMTKSFKFPTEIRSRDNSSLANRFTGALEIFDSGWSQSKHDNILSTQGVQSSQFGDLMHQRSLDNIYDANNLDDIPQDDFSFLSTAF